MHRFGAQGQEERFQCMHRLHLAAWWPGIMRMRFLPLGLRKATHLG